MFQLFKNKPNLLDKANKWIDSNVETIERDMKQKSINDTVTKVINAICYNQNNFDESEQLQIILAVNSKILDLKKAKKKRLLKELSDIKSIIVELEKL